MPNNAMQFLFGDRELLMGEHDLLNAPTEVIVNSTDRSLSHLQGQAANIAAAAESRLQRECEQLLEEYGSLESGHAVYTSAGNLPYKAIIHAIVPDSDDDADHVIQQMVSRSLLLCEANNWRSIAFPAMGHEGADIPIDVSARACFRAVTRFWDARNESSVEQIIFCLTPTQYQPFFDAFREDAFSEPEGQPLTEQTDTEPTVGVVDLNEQDIAETDDDEINQWFK